MCCVPSSVHSELQRLQGEVSGAVDRAQQLKKQIKVGGLQMAASDRHGEVYDTCVSNFS